MSGATTPARRLLALLEEEQSLETRQRDEIDADLAAFGINPAGPIRLARRLAGQRSEPAAALLDAVIEAEATEAEIAALESADIDDVRGRLQVGTVAAVTAEAHRRAGARTNVVGIARRRRGAFRAWAGSLAGVAAAVLIVVAAWWPRSDVPELEFAVEGRVAPEMAEMRAGRSELAPLAEEAPASAAPVTDRMSALEAPRPEPEGVRRSAEPEPLDAPGATPQPSPVPPMTASRPAGPLGGDSAESVEAGGTTGYMAGGEPPASAVEEMAAAPPLPPPTPTEGRAPSAAIAVAPADTVPEDAARARGAAETSRGQDSTLDTSVRGLNVGAAPRPPTMAVPDRQFVVTDMAFFPPADADLAESLADASIVMEADRRRAGADDWPGLVTDRLPEARQFAEGRTILALLTLRSGDAEFDVLLVRTRVSPPQQASDHPPHPLLMRWFGDQASNFALIALPPR